jgi:hypothetical protein
MRQLYPDSHYYVYPGIADIGRPHHSARCGIREASAQMMNLRIVYYAGRPND